MCAKLLSLSLLLSPPLVFVCRHVVVACITIVLHRLIFLRACLFHFHGVVVALLNCTRTSCVAAARWQPTGLFVLHFRTGQALYISCIMCTFSWSRIGSCPRAVTALSLLGSLFLLNLCMPAHTHVSGHWECYLRDVSLLHNRGSRGFSLMMYPLFVPVGTT